MQFTTTAIQTRRSGTNDDASPVEHSNSSSSGSGNDATTGTTTAEAAPALQLGPPLQRPPEGWDLRTPSQSVRTIPIPTIPY